MANFDYVTGSERSETESCPSIEVSSLKSAMQSLALQHTGTEPQWTPESIFLNELPCYDEFFSRFLIRNQLCVLSEKATKEWHSRQNWVCPDGSPNFIFLRKMFGESEFQTLLPLMPDFLQAVLLFF